MIDSTIEFVAVFLLRSLQMLALCAPTLLCGMLVAGVTQCWIGEARVRAWFGRPGVASTVRAAIAALLLPVCGVGVWPVLVTLRRLGASVAPLVTLALASAVATPWTLGYLFDRAGFATGAALLLTVATIAVACGLVAGWGERRDVQPGETGQQPIGSGLFAIAVAAGRSMGRPAWAAVALAAIGAGLLGAAIPPNMVGEWLVERSATHAALIAAVSTLHYAAPAAVAMHAGEVVGASTMPGLLVPLVGVGPALNLGAIVLGAFMLGARRSAAVAATLVLLTGMAALVFDKALYDDRYEPTDSHAFEDLGRPFQVLHHPGGAGAWFVTRFARPLQPLHGAAAAAVVAIWLFGLRRTRAERGELDVANVTPSTARPRVLAGAGTAWVVGTALLAAYTYYPSPDVLIAEARLRAAEMNDAFRGDRDGERSRAQAQLVRRLGQLPVSLRLHGWSFPEPARSRHAELLDQATQAGSADDAAQAFAGVAALERALRAGGDR